MSCARSSHLRGSKLRWLGAVVLTVCITAPLGRMALADADARAAQKLIAGPGRAIVRFSFVIEFDRGTGTERVDGEVSAVLVGKDGLLLVPDALISPEAPPGVRSDSTNTQALRVRIEGRDFDARLVVRDPELGLAWLRVIKPPEDLPYVDLDRRGEAEPGHQYWALARSSRDLGEALLIARGQIVGRTTTPTAMLLASGPFDLAFDSRGRVLGFVVRIRFRNADVQNAMRFGGLVPQGLIDAKRLQQATQQALQQEASAKKITPRAQERNRKRATDKHR